MNGNSEKSRTPRVVPESERCLSLRMRLNTFTFYLGVALLLLYIQDSMRVITQYFSSSSPRLELYCHEVPLEPKVTMRPHFGFKYYVREAKLKYLFSDASRIGVLKEAMKLLIHDLRLNTTPTLLFSFMCIVYNIEANDAVTVKFFDPTNENLIWVSRQAILGGIKPQYLDETIDYNFFRGALDVKVRIWSTDKLSAIEELMSEPPLSQLTQIWDSDPDQKNVLALVHKTIEDASVHHGKFITSDSRIFPISTEQSFTGCSWPSDTYVKYKSNHYMMQSNSFIRLPDAIFLGLSNNWYHFLAEYLPRYLSIPYQMRRLPTIIPKQANSQSLELLRLAGFSNLVLTDLLETVQVDRLLTVLDFRYSSSFDFPSRRKDFLFLQNFFSNLEVLEGEKSGSKHILLMRPRNTFRQMNNATSLITQLEEFGFQVIYPDKLSFAEQFSIFRRAEVIVGQSGAALTSMLFAKKETKIFELGDWDQDSEMFFWRDFGRAIGMKVTSICAKPKTFWQVINDNFSCDIDELLNEISKAH